ncbi:MAG: zf-HC2 domain-containing protein, partial [Acidimicrobiales bacterium]
MIVKLDHDAVAELLGAYALDAVDPDEAQVVADHLAECPRCRAEVDELRAVAAALGNAHEDPPPEVWDRIAQGIGTGELVAPPTATGPSGAPERSAGAPSGSPESPAPLR